MRHLNLLKEKVDRPLATSHGADSLSDALREAHSAIRRNLKNAAEVSSSTKFLSLTKTHMSPKLHSIKNCVFICAPPYTLDCNPELIHS